MEKIRGVVQKINYFNEENHFGIVRIKIDYKDKDMVQYRGILFSNILSVLCTFDRKPIIDEEYLFTGELETSSYGLQLKAQTFERCNEQSKEGLITYLSSDFFPGIGISAATKVFQALGEDAIEKIVHDREVLKDIDISEKQKDVLYENLVIHYQNEKQLVELLGLGLSMKLSIRIIQALGTDALKTVKENPYQLMYSVEGIAFLKADEIAMKVNIPKNSPYRLKAMILYLLKQNIYSTGNTYILLSELRMKSLQYANQEEEILDKDAFLDLIHEMIQDKQIILEEDGSVFEPQIYREEIKVARYIYSFLNQSTQDYPTSKIPQTIERVMEANKIEYSPKQKEAIQKALTEPIMIITGGPGTGKSTIIKGIIDCYSAMFQKSDIIREKIALVAPTGRASKRLREVTYHDACTIHKLLGYEGNGLFAVNEDSPLDMKMIIIDEFSMVDISLACRLFSAILPTTKIIIVGDSDQLPAVGVGNVLLDLIECKEITTIRLDKIHRQASNSSIITLAHSINQGRMPLDIFEKKEDRSFHACSDLDMMEAIKKVVKKGMKKGMDLVKDIQVLIPLYHGIVGIDKINMEMQQYFNPSEEEIQYNGKKFRVNDKVIQLVNRSDKQVMNGDIGYVLTIQKNLKTCTGLDVMFDFGSVHYEKDELDDLSLAYAISIHKSQGSEFPLVIVPFSFKYYIMLKKKLIYTAITRAKKYLILLGNFEAFRKGIVETEEERKTKLKARIQMVIENPNRIFDENSAFDEIITETNNFEKKDFMEMENISPYDFMDNDE